MPRARLSLLSSTVAQKRWVWATAVVLIAWGLWAAARGATGLPPPLEGRGNDLQMYAAVTARVAAGENYYRVLADELPSRGYAVRPVFNWRLPTLTWLNALPPSPMWGRGLFIALGIVVMVLWFVVIRINIPRAAPLSVPMLIIGVAPLVAVSGSVVFYEVWAGLLIAASLATWGLGYWRISVIFGAAALFIRELALPYVLLMAGLAWWEGRRREAVAWVGVSVAFAAFWAWHISRVLPVLPAGGLENSWAVAGGWGFVLKASHASIFLMLVPERYEHWSVAIAVPLLWAGCWYWADTLGRRLALVLSGYFGLFMFVGRPDNWYWGFLVAPLIPLGAVGYFFGLRPARKTWRKQSS